MSMYDVSRGTVGQAIANAERALKKRRASRLRNLRAAVRDAARRLVEDARGSSAFVHVPLQPRTREERGAVVAAVNGYVGNARWNLWVRTAGELGVAMSAEALDAWKRAVREVAS